MAGPRSSGSTVVCGFLPQSQEQPTLGVRFQMLRSVALPVLPLAPAPAPCGGPGQALLAAGRPFAGSWLAEWAWEVGFWWAPA